MSNHEELAEVLEEHAEVIGKKLEKNTEYVEKRLGRFFFKALIAFAIIGMSSAGSLFGFTVVLKEIQTQRYDTIVMNCEQQNDRHDKTIARAKELLPERVQEAVILIVNELQPYVEDCEAFARKRVKGPR